MAPRNTRDSNRVGHRAVSGYSDYDAYVAEQTREPFRFTWLARDWEMTHKDMLDSWDVIAEDDYSTSEEQILAVFELALGDQLEELRANPLPVGVMEKIFEDYTAYCGVKPGESKRSAGS